MTSGAILQMENIAVFGNVLARDRHHARGHGHSFSLVMTVPLAAIAPESFNLVIRNGDRRILIDRKGVTASNR
jgi:hypothetical protein